MKSFREILKQTACGWKAYEVVPAACFVVLCFILSLTWSWLESLCFMVFSLQIIFMLKRKAIAHLLGIAAYAIIPVLSGSWPVCIASFGLILLSFYAFKSWQKHEDDNGCANVVRMCWLERLMLGIGVLSLIGPSGMVLGAINGSESTGYFYAFVLVSICIGLLAAAWRYAEAWWIAALCSGMLCALCRSGLSYAWMLVFLVSCAGALSWEIYARRNEDD